MPSTLRLSTALAWASLTAAYAGPVLADQLVPSDEPAASAAAAAAGKYGGVSPGTNARNPLPPAPADSPRLIWTGFQPTATGSRIFLQTTQAVTYEVQEGRPSKAGRSTLTVILRGCRVHMANNRRRIDTRAFPTPVQGFAAKQRRGDVELRVTLREPASAAAGTEAGPDGTHFLVLDFPPGKAAPVEDIASPALREDEEHATEVISGTGRDLRLVRTSPSSGSGATEEKPRKPKARGKGKGEPDEGAEGKDEPKR